MQLYPGWSARDNYGYGSKKKKRKKDRSPAELGGIGPLGSTRELRNTLHLPTPPPQPLLDSQHVVTNTSEEDHNNSHRACSTNMQRTDDPFPYVSVCVRVCTVGPGKACARKAAEGASRCGARGDPATALSELRSLSASCHSPGPPARLLVFCVQ